MNRLGVQGGGFHVSLIVVVALMEFRNSHRKVSLVLVMYEKNIYCVVRIGASVPE